VFCAEEQINDKRKKIQAKSRVQRGVGVISYPAWFEGSWHRNKLSVVGYSWINETGGTLDGCSLDRIVMKMSDAANAASSKDRGSRQLAILHVALFCRAVGR